MRDKPDILIISNLHNATRAITIEEFEPDYPQPRKNCRANLPTTGGHRKRRPVAPWCSAVAGERQPSGWPWAETARWWSMEVKSWLGGGSWLADDGDVWWRNGSCGGSAGFGLMMEAADGGEEKSGRRGRWRVVELRSLVDEAAAVTEIGESRTAARWIWLIGGGSRRRWRDPRRPPRCCPPSLGGGSVLAAGWPFFAAFSSPWWRWRPAGLKALEAADWPCGQ
ncbi:hypothetical protein Dimus_021095, partial [Dionaea muscipula]